MGCLQRGPQPQSLNGRSQAPSLPVALSIEQNSLMLLLCTPLSHLWRVCMQHRLHPPLRSLTIAPSACLPLQTPRYLQAQCDNTNPFYHAPQRSWQSFQTLLSLSYRCYKKRKIIEHKISKLLSTLSPEFGRNSGVDRSGSSEFLIGRCILSLWKWRSNLGV